MLTLLETTNAINALDTELDVIHNACEQVIYGPLKQRLSPTADATAIAQDITLAYGRLIENKGELLIACLIAAGVTAAFTCKPGHEVPLLQGCSEQLRKTFIECRSRRMAELYRQDPEKAVDQLMALLNQK